MTHNPLTSLEMARLHVKIVWLSVATITTFFYGSWKLNSSRLSSTNHDSYYHIWKLKVKFLQESNEPKTHSKLRQNIAFWEKIYFQQLLVEICLDLYWFCFHFYTSNLLKNFQGLISTQFNILNRGQELEFGRQGADKRIEVTSFRTSIIVAVPTYS